MAMLRNPSTKYRPFPPMNLPNRQWPSKSIQKPPRWLSTDLRDGNQALVDPMDSDQKFAYFKLLVELGYKEIEVAFPSASDTDYNFVRRLIETPGLTPDDIWIQVLTPCRPDLIRRTVNSLKESKKAILHLYLATSPCFQQIVFNMTNEQTKALAVECTKLARSLTKDSDDPSFTDTEWAYEFSPETFSDSNMDFVLEVCEAVKAAWEPSIQNPIIFNLPSTVECASPNVYADQIEYFCTNISERQNVCISLHPHNDRGCAVAAAELAQMAGADRVEGTLFGNGERTGNADLVTLALNLYTQGIHPGIDFSEITKVIDIVEKSTKIPVHPRAPYGGQLVVCAFSGSHQDAIKKGFTARELSKAKHEDLWKLPYLPFDPVDIGRTYEAVIRVNSQSGKGGAAWIILRHLNLNLPRGLQIAFSKIVQKQADHLSRELKPTEIIQLFEDTYLQSTIELVDYDISADRSASLGSEPGQTHSSTNLNRMFRGVIAMNGRQHHLSGVGNGAISSLANALNQSLGFVLDVTDYKEHAIGEGKEVKAATYIECTTSGNEQKKVWGVAIHQDVVQASLMALLSAASSTAA